MNENTKKFRTAVGGYNKEDVNAYIQETDLANREKQNALQKELDRQASEREAWTAEKEQLQAAQEGLRSTVQEQQQQLTAQTETIQNLQTQVQDIETILTEKAKLAEQVEQQTSTIHALQEKLAAAETACAAAEKALAETKAEAEMALTAEKERAAKEIEQIKTAYMEEETGAGYKIRMYDRISGQIGDILLGANRDADDILNRAKEEAEQMQTETADALTQERNAVQAELDQLQADVKAEAACVRKKLSETTGTLLADISGEMRLNIENCLKELSTCMTEVESDTETLFQTMQRRYQEMNERIQYYQSCMQERIDTHLTEMDEQYAIQESGREN